MPRVDGSIGRARPEWMGPTMGRRRRSVASWVLVLPSCSWSDGLLARQSRRGSLTRQQSGGGRGGWGRAPMRSFDHSLSSPTRGMPFDGIGSSGEQAGLVGCSSAARVLQCVGQLESVRVLVGERAEKVLPLVRESFWMIDCDRRRRMREEGETGSTERTRW